MTDLPSILPTCSAWELDWLRAAGLAIPARMKGAKIDLDYRDLVSWKVKKLRPAPKPRWEHKRPGRKVGNGIAVRSNRSERWTAIKLAARELGIPETRVRNAIKMRRPCCGRMLWIERVAA